MVVRDRFAATLYRLAAGRLDAGRAATYLGQRE
jgi:hypothetical protein